MEHLGSVPMVDWSSFNSRMWDEESDLMAELLAPYPSTDHKSHDPSHEMPPFFWPDYDPSFEIPSSSCYWPQMCGGESEMYYLGDSDTAPLISTSSLRMDLGEQIHSSAVQIVPTNQLEDPMYLNDHEDTSVPIALADQISLPKRKLGAGNDDKPILTEGPNKKARASKKANNNMKNARSKKAQKSIEVGIEEESNPASNGQSSGYCSSDNDSNASEELIRGGGGGLSSSSKDKAAVNLNGKTRAGRGSATDPQSLYARKRRERINERLKVLQNLVPNGTKVDISTMLEEAVQYVKFLQLQIKLLSSNDLWMYAPITYNGMDIGIDVKISPGN